MVSKGDLAVVGFAQQSGIEQCGYVAMHSLDVAPDATLPRYQTLCYFKLKLA